VPAPAPAQELRQVRGLQPVQAVEPVRELAPEPLPARPVRARRLVLAPVQVRVSLPLQPARAAAQAARPAAGWAARR
jgi:hypothetical protein